MAGPITPLSRQLDIMQAFTAQLQGITPANGYAYDLSSSVYRGRVTFGDEAPLPCVSILEAPRPGPSLVADESNLVRTQSWDLLVQGWVQDDKTNPLDPVYGLKASVERQLSRVVAVAQGFPGGLYAAEYLLGKPAGSNSYRIAEMRIGPGVSRPPDKLSVRAYFFLPVSVKYKEDIGSPFV